MDIFKVALFSFFRPETCKEAVLNWRWNSIIFFAWLSATSAIGVIIGAREPLEKIYDDTMSRARDTLKTIKIQDGKIITPDGKDVFFKSPDGSIFGVASQNYIDANKTKGLIFALEKDRITLYTPNGGETFFSAKDYKPIIGDSPTTADSLIPPKDIMMSVFLPTLAIVFAISMNLMYALMMTAACYILSRTIYPMLTFWQSAKLAIIALAPSTIIDFLSVTLLGQATLGFVYALISGGVAFYLLKKFALSETPKSE